MIQHSKLIILKLNIATLSQQFNIQNSKFKTQNSKLKIQNSKCKTLPIIVTIQFCPFR